MHIPWLLSKLGIYIPHTYIIIKQKSPSVVSYWFVQKKQHHLLTSTQGQEEEEKMIICSLCHESLKSSLSPSLKGFTPHIVSPNLVVRGMYCISAIFLFRTASLSLLCICLCSLSYFVFKSHVSNWMTLYLDSRDKFPCCQLLHPNFCIRGSL